VFNFLTIVVDTLICFILSTVEEFDSFDLLAYFSTVWFSTTNLLEHSLVSPTSWISTVWLILAVCFSAICLVPPVCRVPFGYKYHKFVIAQFG